MQTHTVFIPQIQLLLLILHNFVPKMFYANVFLLLSQFFKCLFGLHNIHAMQSSVLQHCDMDGCNISQTTLELKTDFMSPPRCFNLIKAKHSTRVAGYKPQCQKKIFLS